MNDVYDKIDRQLRRDIEAIENSGMDGDEKAREIRELERQARWDYDEERATEIEREWG